MSFPRSGKSLIRIGLAAAVLTTFAAAPDVQASSHMDAPLITLDDAANTTDVYAFVSQTDETKYLTTAVAVYPFEEPGIGPNKFNFDDNARYDIHVALGNDVAAGRPTLSYYFNFKTNFKNDNTILQSYLDVVNSLDDSAQNLTQTYTVTRVDRREKKRKNRVRVIGTGVVPPNNQGFATPLYNEAIGFGPAKDGVATAAELDDYTADSIATLDDGYMAFAGQRDDGFYADIQAVFDLLRFRIGDGPFDSQGGFNTHTIALNIPVEELGGDLQEVGVYATVNRRRTTVRRGINGERNRGGFVQVSRQGNPLFNEGFVAIKDKDRYSGSSPKLDDKLFRKYAETPELAALANFLLFGGTEVAIETGRTDLAGIYIPDVIKVDLSTPPARLAGGGPNHATNPDDAGFSRMGLFDPFLPDTLFSELKQTDIPGGWPNGRRFGDDVLDIAVSALISDLRDPDNLVVNSAAGIDSVDQNDIAYNKVFPYAAPPHSGRNHPHHGEEQRSE